MKYFPGRSAGVSLASICLSLGIFTAGVSGLDLDINDKDSIKKAASAAAWGMVSFYQGNVSGNTPGTLPGPAGSPQGYYWWEGGLMFGSLIDYWYYTGDDSYNAVTTQGLLEQVGEFDNYEPSNYTLQLGNDDQAFWGMAALLAAETNFPNPPADKPQWMSLAQAVVNRQLGRWPIDSQTCNGGLRWQFNIQQKGYTYKNAISNGCFFNMLARVGRYTANATYFNMAETVYDWTEGIGIIDKDYNVFDGVDQPNNCSNLHQLLFSYNAAVFLYGAAVMWNQTQNGGLVPASEAPKWEDRVNGLLNRTLFTFFRNNVMTEFECEGPNNCNSDMRSYKSILARWLATTAKAAPFTYDAIYANLRPSAQAAARVCDAGSTGEECGLKWVASTSDGSFGIGEQMSAMEVFNSLLIDDVPGPLTGKSGGTSQSDPSAGTGNEVVSADNPAPLKDITTADKAGAGILTAMVVCTVLGGAVWMTVF